MTRKLSPSEFMSLDNKALAEAVLPGTKFIADFSAEGPGAGVTLDDMAKMTPQELEALKSAVEKHFTKVKEGYVFSGSIMASIFSRGFKSPSALAAGITGAYKEEFSEATLAMFRTGHDAEPYARSKLAKLTGNPVREFDVNFMQDEEYCIKNRLPFYPHARANIDGLTMQDGKVGIIEIKWTSTPAMIAKHYGKMHDARKAGQEPPWLYVPEKYLYQIWFYLAMTNLDYCIFCGIWGFGDDQFGYCYVPRLPKDKEMALMEAGEDFIEMIEAGITPSDRDVRDKVKLAEVYQELHAAMPKSGKLVTFSSKQEASVVKMLELEREVRVLEKKFKAEKEEFAEKSPTSQELERKKQELASIQTYFMGEMAGATEAVIHGKDTDYFLGYEKKPRARGSVNTAKLKKEYPDVYDDVFSLPKDKKVLTTTCAVRGGEAKCS